MKMKSRLLKGACEKEEDCSKEPCDKSEVACRRMFEDRVKFNRNLNR